MPDEAKPKPEQPKTEPAYLGPVHKARARETADQRRTRQTAVALTAQAELKREAAERRARNANK